MASSSLTAMSRSSNSVSPSRSPDLFQSEIKKAKKPREEIHFLLLLQKTEQHFSNFATEGQITDLKVVYFVKHLNEMLINLENHAQRPDKDDFIEYKSRVKFLEKLVEDLMPREDPIPRLGFEIPCLGIKKDDPVLIQGSDSLKQSDLDDENGYLYSVLPELKNAKKTQLPKALGNDTIVSKQIHQKRDQKNLLSDRSALFGESDNELRHRQVGNFSTNDSELNSLLKAHHEAQEHVAEEMILLTKSLKEQSLAANEFIKKDTKSLELTNELADKNTSRLAIESDRLSEHTKRTCRCWIWFVLLIVTLTFIAMVLLMKLFRKRNV